MAEDRRDLFGDPIARSTGRGRPRHRPSQHLREIVAAKAAEGATLLEISAAIGITHPTLLLNYRDELGSTSKAAERRQRRDQAKKGNI